MAAKTANVLARVEPDVKEQAEAIMAQLGIPASVVINMLYKQIIMRKAIPFPLMVVERPKARDEMSDEEFAREINIGLKQAERGEGIPAHEFFKQIRRELV